MTATETELRPAVFTMYVFEAASSDSLRLFPGLTLGERWNGWACPYFTYSQAQALSAGWNALGAEAHYDAASDQFVFGPLDAAEQLPEQYGSVEIGGSRFYPIGTHAWTWDEINGEKK